MIPTIGMTRLMNLLEADANIVSFFGTRLYWGRFPEDVELPGLFFRVRPGEGKNTLPIRNQSMEFQIYGNTELQAVVGYELVHTALMGDFADRSAQAVVWRTHELIDVEVEIEGQFLIDTSGEGKGTPYMLAFFVVNFANI